MSWRSSAGLRNKTLVMRDKTAGKSVEVVINEAAWLYTQKKQSCSRTVSWRRLPVQVLAETCWGRFEGDQWILVSDQKLGTLRTS